jgi:hypothetical protein
MGKRRAKPRRWKGYSIWSNAALNKGKRTPDTSILRERNRAAHIPIKDSFEQMRDIKVNQLRHNYYDIPITPPKTIEKEPKTDWEVIQLMHYWVHRPGKLLKIEVRFSGHVYVIVKYDYLEKVASYSHVYNSRDTVMQRLNFGIAGISWRGSVQLQE